VALAVLVSASDPELTTDFFVPEGVNASTITGDYFTSTILRNGTGLVPPAKFAIRRVNSENFPALTGLGISSALLEYLPGGINTLHTHPRGTELLYVLKGTLHVGLVDSANKLYVQVLEKRDLFVFPKGLVHYQINLGNKTVYAYAAFSSSNPGTISLPANIFASGIEDYVLEAAFKVNQTIIDTLQAAQAT
jgi:oxalate decarboxylase/phosphoglucose isomerase-like protein (cupin superfamily)